MENRALVGKIFYKENCALAALKKFQPLKEMKNGCGPMSTKGLKKTFKKFEEIGSFKGKSSQGRKLIASTSVKRVVTALQDGTRNDVFNPAVPDRFTAINVTCKC